MSAAELRQLDEIEVLDEIYRQLAFARSMMSAVKMVRVGEPSKNREFIPLIEFGDFEVWPRGTVSRVMRWRAG